MDTSAPPTTMTAIANSAAVFILSLRDAYSSYCFFSRACLNLKHCPATASIDSLLYAVISAGFSARPTTKASARTSMARCSSSGWVRISLARMSMLTTFLAGPTYR
jgi:hypothetical protein